MKKRLKAVSKTRNRSVRATAENSDPVNRFTTKMSPERKIPALSERAHLFATRPRNNRGICDASSMTMTQTFAKRSAGIRTATTSRNFVRGSSRWTGVFRVENLNPSRVLRDNCLFLAELFF